MSAPTVTVPLAPQISLCSGSVVSARAGAADSIATAAAMQMLVIRFMSQQYQKVAYVMFCRA